jgi:hypothetical protein
MKKILTIIIMVILAGGLTQAQDKPAGLGYTPSSYYTFSWNNTFPIGDLHHWVSQPSPAGFDMGGRYFVKDGIAFGWNICWQRVAKNYDAQTFTIPEKGIALTATNYRFTWMVPFQAVVAYHLNPGNAVSPYVSLGIGGDYMEHHLMIQEYDIYKTRWDFSLTPEIGALVKFGSFSNWGAIVAFNYKWTTNKIEVDVNDVTSKNLQMLNLKVGIAMIIR